MVSHKNNKESSHSRDTVRTLEERIKSALDSGSDKSVVRVEIESEVSDPLAWISPQPFSQSVYWHDREDAFETAGLGVADGLDDSTEPTIESALARVKKTLERADDNVRYFGGMRFDPEREPDENWTAFGKYRFVLPRFELFIAGSHRSLACNLLPDRDADNVAEILEQLHSLKWEATNLSESIPTVAGREDSPDPEQWQDMIDSALDSIDGERLEKIVLARKRVLRFERHLQPEMLLRRLRHVKDCFHFNVQPAPGICFMGATPERLYSRHGDNLKCEAIAGTRPRGETNKEDSELQEQLMTSDKEIREHRLVAESIQKSLTRFATITREPKQIPETVLKLQRVQHLITRMEWILNENTTDTDLLAALHPTPAVGGYPKDGICAEIEKLETFDRGWYAGPVGWIGKDSADFAVAIRSALLTRERSTLSLQHRLSLFAGAGIVKGSRAQAEWEEIESKMSGFMGVMD